MGTAERVGGIGSAAGVERAVEGSRQRGGRRFEVLLSESELPAASEQRGLLRGGQRLARCLVKQTPRLAELVQTQREFRVEQELRRRTLLVGRIDASTIGNDFLAIKASGGACAKRPVKLRLPHAAVLAVQLR